jgi:hypothetical protein
MSATPNRLELLIDIFDLKSQQAQALPTLTPPELVEGILQEFRELEYLGDTAADYHLFKIEDKSPLKNEHPLQQQLTNSERLILVERRLPLPEGATRFGQEAYLREQTTGKVYKLHWQPAVIGRPDKNQPYDNWIAVNLEPYQTGLRVSRRQAMITEENGQYFVKSMSPNPTALKTADGQTISIGSQRHPLQPGDIIFLERSNIALKFIVR